MKRAICLIACLLLFSGTALAEETLELPGGRYELRLPEGFETEDCGEDEELRLVLTGGELEIDIFAYPRGDSSLQELAEQLEGAEIREINGVTALCYRTVDEADGAPCIGYVLEDGETLIELACWYGTEEAGEAALDIVSTLLRKD